MNRLPISLAVILCARAMLPPAVLGQELRTLPHATEITEATSLVESEGGSFPRAEAAAEFPDYATIRLGSAERACTVVSNSGPARSGEFIIGAQIADLRSGRPGKVWWAPLHNSEDMELLVRGRLIDTPSDTLRWINKNVAFPVDPRAEPRKREEINDWFFPSRFILPKPGQWIVVATSGVNWGCFVLFAS